MPKAELFRTDRSGVDRGAAGVGVGHRQRQLAAAGIGHEPVPEMVPDKVWLAELPYIQRTIVGDVRRIVPPPSEPAASVPACRR